MNPKAIRWMLSVWVLGLCLGLVVSMPVHAQVSGATLSGTITDPQGGAVPNAKVSARDVATGVSTDTETNGSGAYTIPNLNPSDYEISVTAQGFSTAVSKITLTVGQKQELNIPLAVGQVEQSVQVTTEAPQVELESSTISSEVNATTVRELPLNGRDWASLATLQPTVVQSRTQLAQANPSHVGAGGRGFGDQLSVGGGRPTQNSYRLDGAIVNDYSNAGPGSVLGANLGVDAIQEFSVLTSNYSAEYGFTSGGVINAVTKSGTNSFHGTGFDFLRNDDLDARDFFTKAQEGCTSNCLLPKNLLQQNQFGAAAGYRILKDKLFLFGDYEGVRRNSSSAQTTTTTISNAVRSGVVANEEGIVSGTTECTASAFNCPTSTVSIDPNIAKMLALFPAPTNPLTNQDSGPFNFVGNGTATENFVTGRGDYKLSDKDSLFATYLRDTSSLFTPLTFNILTQETTSYRQGIIAEETHVFSPSWVNTFRVADDRTNNHGGLTPIAVNPAGADPTLGEIGAGAPGGYGEYAPSMALTGSGITSTTSGIGGGASIQTFAGQIMQVYDDAFHQAGNHGLKFGGMFLAYQVNVFTPLAGSDGSGTFGPLGFFNSATGLNSPTTVESNDCLIANKAAGNTSNYDAACSGLVNLLTDQPVSAARPFDGSQPGVNEHYLRDKIVGLYLQDDWKARKNLTLNLGIRYEPSTIPSEIHGEIDELPSMFTVPPCEPQAGGAPTQSLDCPEPSVALANIQGNNGFGLAGFPTMAQPSVSGAVPTTALSNKFFDRNPTLGNIEPRIGFAWDVFGDGKTSVRGGVGVFDSLPLPYILSLNSTSQYPFRPNHYSLGSQLSSAPSIAAGTTATTAGEWPYDVVSLVGNNEIVNPLSAPGGFDYLDNAIKRNYIYQFNFSIQRQLTSDTTITIGYSGSRGYHQPFQADSFNTVVPVNIDHPIPGIGYYWQGCTPGEMNALIPGYTLPGFSGTNITPAGTPLGSSGTVSPGACNVTNSATNIADEWAGATNLTTVEKDARLLNPSMGSAYTTIWESRSWYDALQVNVVRRMSHGLQLQGAFTWSHSIDTSSGSSAGDTFDLANASTPWYDLSLDKGPSEFNVGLNLVINATWIIPTPKNMGGVLDHVLGGWQLGGIFTSGSGVPIEPAINEDVLGEVVATTNPPFLTPGCTNTSAIDTNYRHDLSYLISTPEGSATLGCLGLVPQTAADLPYCDNTNVGRSGAFPTGYCPNIRGNLGRDAIAGPGLIQMNASLFKNNYIPKISESFNIQFRLEVFNLTNHENFAPPPTENLLTNTNGVLNNTNTGGAGFEQLSGTQGTDREIQLALKVIW